MANYEKIVFITTVGYYNSRDHKSARINNLQHPAVQAYTLHPSDLSYLTLGTTHTVQPSDTQTLCVVEIDITKKTATATRFAYTESGCTAHQRTNIAIPATDAQLNNDETGKQATQHNLKYFNDYTTNEVKLERLPTIPTNHADTLLVKDGIAMTPTLSYWKKAKQIFVRYKLGYVCLALLATAIAASILFTGAAPAAIASAAFGTKFLMTIAFFIGAPSLVAYYRTAMTLKPWPAPSNTRMPVCKKDGTSVYESLTRDLGLTAALRILKLFIYGTGALPMMVICVLPISKALGITVSKTATYHMLSHLTHGTMLAKCMAALLVLASIQLLGAMVATFIRVTADKNQRLFPKTAKCLHAFAATLECILPLSLALFATQAPIAGAQAIAKGVSASCKTAAAFTGIIQATPVVPAAITMMALSCVKAKQRREIAPHKTYDNNAQSYCSSK